MMKDSKMKGELTRRRFLRTGVAASLGLSVATRLSAQNGKKPRKPNLIFLLPDQQRADTLTCYGSRHPLAPNLDKLASQSFVFQNAYVTQPICTPSRSSLLTGTWPHANGCTHNETTLDHRLACLPELLSDADYRYAYFGKWHLGDEFSAQHGFTEWVSIMDRTLDKHGVAGAVSDYSKYLFSKGLKPRGKHPPPFFTRGDIARLPYELSQPKFLETKACEFLERNRDHPFVLFVSYWEPHPPYKGPLDNLHPMSEIELEPTYGHAFGPEIPLSYRLRQGMDERAYGKESSKHLAIKQHYFGLVTEVDRSIGAILTKLEEMGLADHTVVVHTSDHGDMMGAHNLFGKAVLFQEAARVPCLVRMPGQQRSVNVDGPFSHIDLAPTLLELLGGKEHPQCAGKSRAAVLRGEKLPVEPIYMQWAFEPFKLHPGDDELKDPKNQAAIHQTTRAIVSPEGWKLCLRNGDLNELYKMKDDPREEHNLYGGEEHKEIVETLTKQIYAWQEKVKDTIKV